MDALRHGSMSVELFVPAGVPHRFVDLEPGFRTWLVFWGPSGGEAPRPTS